MIKIKKLCRDMNEEQLNAVRQLMSSDPWPDADDGIALLHTEALDAQIEQLQAKIKQLETENKTVKIKLKAADLLLEYIRENYLPLTQSIGIDDE